MWGHNGPGYPTSPPPHASACRLPAGGRSRQTREVVGRWGPGPLRARIRHWLLPRCKRQMQDAQHKQATQGGGGGKKGRGDKPSQTADRPKPPPNKKPETRKTDPDKNNKQAIWPTEKQKPKKTTIGKTRGESHAVYRKSMKEKNASEMIVKSSVVPKQKPGKQKNTEKTASNSSRRSQSPAERNKSRHSLRSHPENRRKEIRREPNPRNNI